MSAPTEKTIAPSRKTSVYAHFNGPLRDYSVYANIRALPSLMDGFNPSQRKIVYAAKKKDPQLSQDGIKVSQLAMYAAEITEYHHGEGSLEGTIIGLAQNYPGSNNVNYLEPIGQFGSRLSPEPGAGRYIFTKLAKGFTGIFKSEDDDILPKQFVDGFQIEPAFYLPIIPMILINGKTGMGTGHAVKILQHDPKSVKNAVISVLKKGTCQETIVPHFRGFNGTVSMNPDTGQVTITGRFTRVNTTTIIVDELPIGMYQDDFKEILNGLEDKGFIHGYDNESTAEAFKFIIKISRANCSLPDEELLARFKLISRETQNFTVWLPNGKLTRFSNANDLVERFVKIRLPFFEQRRQHQLKIISEDIIVNEEMIKFIRWYLADGNSIKASRMKKAELVETLKTDLGLTTAESLVGMPIYTLTADHIEKIEKKNENLREQKKFLDETSSVEMWLKELSDLKI